MTTRQCRSCGVLVTGTWRCDQCKGGRSTSGGAQLSRGAARQPRGTTTERGYGGEHQAARRRALAALINGEPCPYCGTGMWRGMPLDYDHVTPLGLGGASTGPRRLTHAACNRSAGAALGNRIRAGRPPPQPQRPKQHGSRDW